MLLGRCEVLMVVLVVMHVPVPGPSKKCGEVSLNL